jgi:hypothetical protein
MSSNPHPRPARVARNPLTLFTAAALLTTGACAGFGDAMTAHTDVVARAGGEELRVAEAAELLALNPEIPAQPDVVQALAELWVDYMLLASAVAADTSLSTLNLEAFTMPIREQALMMKLRDQVIVADTLFTDEQLRQAWATEGPGAEIRARHILLRIPSDATDAQRDSVRQMAESLRQRATGGEDFAALARQYSQDPGSAQQGGDLDYFGRGRMVAQFEEAAFQLDPGQVSPVVETPFGYHVIRVEDRRQTQLGDQREDFRQFMVSRAYSDAEGAFLDSIAEAANVRIQPGGLAVIREIAARPDATLRGRAATREIAVYEGGAFTSGEFQEFVRTQPAQVQQMFATASDEQLETAVEQLTQKELLLREAERRNVTLTQAQEDSIRTEAREAVRMVVQETGLAGAGRDASPSEVDAHVRRLLSAYISGQIELIPLGRLGFILRDLYPSEINEGAFGEVVTRVTQLREAQPQPAPEPGEGPPQPGQPPQQPAAPGQPGQPPLPGQGTAGPPQGTGPH